MYRLFGSLLFLALVVGAPAGAQQGPPARVGRVSYVSGNLAFHTSGQTEWTAANVNYPVAAGASLWTDAEARSEIRIGATTIDMASTTELDIVALDESTTHLSVPQGRMNLHLRQLGNGQIFEIDIPRGGIWLLQPGIYDIEAGTTDQPARVAVFEGSARFAGDGADVAVKPGEVAVLNGFNPVTASLERAVADAFAEWCRSRDYDENRLASPYYVSPNMTGYAELDRYGRWDTAPGYGEVWYPNVPASWVPYSDGAWAWIGPWGWTWVDAEPWGFAPTHYGRWAFITDRWCWVPGVFEPYPVYAPALVAFLGGPGVGLYVSCAIGPQVAWFPLAPGEVYWPGYRADPSYIRALNRPSVANMESVQISRNGAVSARFTHAQFANRRFAVVVPQHVFAGAGKISAAAFHAGAALQHAPVAMRPPQIRAAAARALSGPGRFVTRPQPGRTGERPSGFGSSVGPMPSEHAAERPGAPAPRTPTPEAGLATPDRPPSAAGGRWPGRPEHAMRGAAPQHSPAARAPQHAFHAAPAPHAAHTPAAPGFTGGFHGGFGGGHAAPAGHMPGGGGHAAPAGHMPGGGGRAAQIAHVPGGGHGGGGGGGHGGGGHHG